MSLSASEMAELWDSLRDLNLSELDNGSRVEMVRCERAFHMSALLFSMCVVYAFIFFIGTAANALVLWVNFRAAPSASRHETHLYITHLAAADLCVCATLPIWVTSLAQQGHWPFGDAMCKLTHLLYSVNLFGSIYFLACMSVDRYLSVKHPGGDGDGRRRKLIRRAVCAGVWLLALASSLPDTCFLQAVRSSDGDTMLCRPVYPAGSAREWMVGVQLSFILLGFLLPFPIITLFYTLLATALSSSSHSSSSSSHSSSSSPSDRVILAYILVFLGCWGPHHAVLLVDSLSLLGLLPHSCGLDSGLYVAMHLTQCLSLLHCCLNPVLYNFLNRNYRYDLMKAFIFKYSTRTGLTRLVEASHVSEAEYSAVALDNHPVVDGRLDSRNLEL